MRLRGVRLLDLSPSHDILAGNDDAPVVDIQVEGAVITEISPASTWNGAWVMPGLWDHHVHMTEWARTFHRLDLSSTATPGAALARVHEAITRCGGRLPAGTLVGVGLWHSRWPVPFGVPGGPVQADLDLVTGEIPTVLISGDLHSAWFNSAAARAYAISPPAPGDSGPWSGLISEEEWFARMPDVAGEDDALPDAWVSQAAARAAGRGVVGVVDFEFHDTHAAWRRRFEHGFSALRVRAAVWPDHLERAIASGYRTADALTPGGLLEMGPLKIISDGSLNTRTAWCHDPYPDGSFGAPNLTEEELQDLMRRAHAAGFHSAIHAIGDRANSSALDAFAATGARGSIEHAQLLGAHDVHRFRDLGVTASVQPAHLLDDRDTAEVLWAGRTHRAYPLADLDRAGVNLRFGSDAPVAPLDPWLAIDAAGRRSAGGRPAWHGEQILDRGSALRASVAAPRVSPGARADLVTLGADPRVLPGDELREIPVLRTMCAGALTFER